MEKCRVKGCPDPKYNTSVYCFKHFTHESNLKKKRKEHKRKLGFCFWCPKARRVKALPGITLCAFHKQAKERYEKDQYAKKFNEGICRYCKDKRLTDSIFCQKHKDQKYKGWKKHFDNKPPNQCNRCSADKLPDSIYCEKHKEKVLEVKRDLYRKKSYNKKIQTNGFTLFGIPKEK